MIASLFLFLNKIPATRHLLENLPSSRIGMHRLRKRSSGAQAPIVASCREKLEFFLQQLNARKCGLNLKKNLQLFAPVQTLSKRGVIKNTCKIKQYIAINAYKHSWLSIKKSFA